MDIIEMTRKLGTALQQDERFIKLRTAEQNSDADQALQNMIGEFNLKRIALSHEAEKNDRDEEKLKKLNQELRGVYAQVMENENMKAYNEAKQEIDDLLKRVNAIISKSVAGEDPATADYVPSNCGDGCASCAGCQ